LIGYFVRQFKFNI